MDDVVWRERLDLLGDRLGGSIAASQSPTTATVASSFISN
jgi:hypothetical protein